MTSSPPTTPMRDKNGIATAGSGHDPPETDSPSPVFADAAPNVAGFSDAVLAVLALSVPQEIAQRKAKAEAQFFELVREQAAVLGVTPTRLAAAISAKATAGAGAKAIDGSNIGGRSVVIAKFRNPQNPLQTWSGRGGTPPKWFSDHLAAGGTEAELIPPEGDQ